MAKMKIKKSEAKIAVNIGCLFDYVSCTFHTGPKGEIITNGGIAKGLYAVVGVANSYKSLIVSFLSNSMTNHISASVPCDSYLHDTEGNVGLDRLNSLGRPFKYLKQPIIDTDTLTVSDAMSVSGEDYIKALVEFTDAKAKEDKVDFVPFKNTKEHIPTPLTLDSFSEFKSSVSIKNLIGNVKEDEGQTILMQAGLFKTKFLNFVMSILNSSNNTMFTTAHVGEKIDMDTGFMAKFNKPTKKLAFIKDKDFIKGVPNLFYFLTNQLWITSSPKTLIHRDSKEPHYPTKDSNKQTTDLNRVVLTAMRNKLGPSGVEIPLIISQSEGVLPALTEFDYIKEHKFGFIGNNINYALAILPEVKLSRKTSRPKIDSDPKLRRAIQITADLLQLMIHHTQYTVSGLWLSPEDLYEAIKSKGYDWDRLLDTRSWWTVDQYNKDLPNYLHTIDLLNMAAGKYVPYWYDKKG